MDSPLFPARTSGVGIDITRSKAGFDCSEFIPVKGESRALIEKDCAMADHMDAEDPAAHASRCQHETARTRRMNVALAIGPMGNRKVLMHRLAGHATEITAKGHVSIITSTHGSLPPIGRFERAVCDIGGGGACARVGNVGGRSKRGDEEASHASPSVRHKSVIGKSSAANGEARGQGDTQPREAKWKW